MNRNLTLTIMAGAGAGIAGSLVPPGQSAVRVMGRGPNLSGIGILLPLVPALYIWRAEVLKFEREELGPAREAAKRGCREKAGL